MWRTLSVAVYGPATLEGRGRYRRPQLAMAAWGLLAGESAWSSLHLWRRDRSPTAVAWADTATAAAIAIAFPQALGADDEDTWHAWGASSAPAQAEVVPLVLSRLPERGAAIALLCAAPALGSVLAPGPTDWAKVARTAAATLFRGLWGSVFADIMRANVTRLDDAHTAAVSASREAALQRARARHRRYLEDRVLGVLDEVANSEHTRDPRLMRAANREAARLRTVLLPADAGHPELAELVELAAARGVDLEVVTGEVAGAFPARAVEAIGAELAAAFEDAGTGVRSVRHVVLFVDVVDGSLVATLYGDDVRREVRLGL